MTLSANTHAILLLTSPLLLGKNPPRFEILSLQEYAQLARRLHELKHTPGDLLGTERQSILESCQPGPSLERLNALLGRELLLSQLVDRWFSRGLWVLSRADAAYPKALKGRLKDACPPILYGCGDQQLLQVGGLAVVGSRNAGECLLEYTREVGALAARAGCAIVSGGARGVDQAAMLGALDEGGKVVGVLGDSLERAALQAPYRPGLREGRLVLTSPFDPAAGFQVGHAMQRNKYIYALAKTALIVSSDYQKGGTWAGAVEQLEKFRFGPVYVRPGEDKGLVALRERGAQVWPEPQDTGGLLAALTPGVTTYTDSQQRFDFVVRERPVDARGRLLATVSQLLSQYPGEKTPDSVSEFLGVTPDQAKIWLESGELDAVEYRPGTVDR